MATKYTKLIIATVYKALRIAYTMGFQLGVLEGIPGVRREDNIGRICLYSLIINYLYFLIITYSSKRFNESYHRVLPK